MTCHPSPLLTENPWNLFHLLTQDDSVVHEWCRQNGILSTGFSCSVDDCSGLVLPLSWPWRACLWMFKEQESYQSVENVFIL